MKDYLISELEETEPFAASVTRRELPSFDDWVAERPELWTAGPEIQQEMFMAMIRARLAS